MNLPRWIWIVMVNGAPCRFYEDGTGITHASFATGFPSRTKANEAKRREIAEYERLRDVCLAGGSPKGVESWTKCIDTICVVRIELPKEVR